MARPTRGGDTDKTYLTDDLSRENDGLLPYVTTKPERKRRYRDKGHDRIMSNQPLDERDVSPVFSGKASADEAVEEPDEKKALGHGKVTQSFFCRRRHAYPR